MTNSSQKHKNLKFDYSQRRKNVLIPLKDELQKHIAERMEGQERIDRISVRAKSVSRFMDKATTSIDSDLKYSEPLNQIQDQLGARIVVFYLSDVAKIQEIVGKYFTAIEEKILVPESESEFGYFGCHMVLVVPSDILSDTIDRSMVPEFFELQIKTLFQHAWSEANHDLGYKPGENILGRDQIRRMAFTSAQAWGADRIFDELFSELANYDN